MKKIVKILTIFVLALVLTTGCGKQEKVNGNLTDLMANLYAGIDEESLPMALTDIELTKENISAFVGTDEFEFEEALGSESMVGSFAHSVVLIRLKDNAKPSYIKEVVSKINEKADPRKWICVEAESKVVLNRGNLILLVMTDTEKAEKIKENFKNL